MDWDKRVEEKAKHYDDINEQIDKLIESVKIHDAQHMKNFLQLLEHFPKVLLNTQVCASKLGEVLSSFEEFMRKRAVKLNKTYYYLQYSKEKHGGDIDYESSIEEGLKQEELNDYITIIKDVMGFKKMKELKFNNQKTYEEFLNEMEQECKLKKN